MIQEWLQADASGKIPDIMNLEVLLIPALDQVLHPHFLLAPDMKIIHGGQSKAVWQFVIILPTIAVCFQHFFLVWG